MGRSTNALLVYGYDLGGEEAWRLSNLGKYGQLPALDWYDPDGDDEDGEGFAGAVRRRLLAQVAGFTEVWKPDNGFFDREYAAQEQVGVKIKTHCSRDAEMYLLVAKVVTAHRGFPEAIDPADVASPLPEWDARLRTALDALGLTPTQETARWLLCSYDG